MAGGLDCYFACYFSFSVLQILKSVDTDFGENLQRLRARKELRRAAAAPNLCRESDALSLARPTSLNVTANRATRLLCGVCRSSVGKLTEATRLRAGETPAISRPAKAHPMNFINFSRSYSRRL